MVTTYHGERVVVPASLARVTSDLPPTTTPEDCVLYMTASLSDTSLGLLEHSKSEQIYGHEEKTRGAIATKWEVVDFMLDLIGYTSNKPLYEKRLLEPSFGDGRFVLAAVDRLLKSWRATEAEEDYRHLLGSIRAVELDEQTFHEYKGRLTNYLREKGFTDDEARELVDSWILHADFLWAEFDEPFDFVIGNPPYVRQELVDDDLLFQYRQAFKTMIGRADLYVPFIEKSLIHLAEGGKFSFICSDAWTRNDYGRALRSMVDADYHLQYYVDMYGVPAFDISVGAYTSITVIERAKKGPTVIAKAEAADRDYLQNLEASITDRKKQATDSAVRLIEGATNGDKPWLLGIGGELKLIRHMENTFGTIQEVGCKVGIGVATGADKAFIVDYMGTEVENGRLLPLATNKDLMSGELKWTGKGVLNPWRDEGGLVDLRDYPKLAARLEEHRPQLEKRHTAKRNVESNWYKTIDRITPSLTNKPKLLIPDIKGNGDAIGYDSGSLYPHHNLYWITSEEWNLRALQALLRSGIALLFVKAYSVKIGGGYLRFQAQNLKRIRLPKWSDISQEDQQAMTEAGEKGERLSVDLLARIYRVDTNDLSELI